MSMEKSKWELILKKTIKMGRREASKTMHGTWRLIWTITSIFQYATDDKPRNND